MKRLWFAALLVAWPGLARAADTDDIESLLGETVVTTASTVAEKASTAPATSVTITAEQLRTFGIRTIAEAMNFLGTGVVAEFPLSTPDVGARGVLLPNDNGKHFLLLIDGHVVNDPLYGAARFDQGAGIPMELVDHIELIVGPGSVLYGSNAMLGVVNVITKRADSYTGGHASAEWEPGRSATASVGAGVPFRLFGKPAEIVTGLEYYERFGPDLQIPVKQYPFSPGVGSLFAFRRGGPADGLYGGTVHDAYYTKAPAGMLTLRAGELEVRLLASLYRRGIPYSTQYENVDFDDPQSYEMDRAIRLDVKHDTRLTSLLELTSRVYADGFDYQRAINRNAAALCFRQDFLTCRYYDVGVARWYGVEERLSFNWLDDLSFVTLVGIDVQRRFVRTKQDATNFDTGAPFAPTTGNISASSSLIAPYVQQTWSPSRALDLNVGARLDAESRFNPQLSPRGAVTITPVTGTAFRAIYSQAFRAPTWAETDISTYHQAPSSGIKPEVVRSVEGSVEQRFGTHRLLFGAFRSSWDSLIENSEISVAEQNRLQQLGQLPITATSVSQYQNVSGLRNFGFDARWDGTLAKGKFAYGASVTESYTRRDVGGSTQPLVVAPARTGNVFASYRLGGYLPTPALAAYYLASRPIDRRDTADFYRNSPDAPALVELRGTLTGPVPKVRGLAYRVSAAWASAATTAYTVGPAGQYLPVTPGSVMAPVDRFRIFFGLRWDFATGEGDTEETR